MSYHHRLQMKIDSRLDQVPLVAVSLKGIARYLEVPEKAVMEVELCLCEMLNNVVEHGYHGEAGHPLVITFEFEPKMLVIKIMDEAEPIPTLAPAEIHVKDDDFDNLSERGYGRYLVRKLMDGMNYETIAGHNIMTLVKQFHAAETREPDAAADSKS